ncbi:MAG: class IV adenylate cyclase [Ignavibacteriales bacterium]|nr:class IV adenylate cyclase [Ignavibacteriales bacterium]
MPQNLELKARISSVSEAVRAAHRLNAHAKGVLQQRDIYYRVPRGRLKLRIIKDRSAELIFYNRPNKKGSRYSDYVVLPVDDAILTNALCTAAFGQKVIVEKKRRLFLYKNSRIHLDEVRGLGTFIEFEVLVNYGKRQAQKLLDVLSKEFAIKPAAVIGISYSDMLLHKQ